MDEEPRQLKYPIMFLFRPNRTIMVSVITGTAAYASTIGLPDGFRLLNALLMTLIGWCLAVSGFSLDFCADKEMDKIAPRSEIRSNPIATGQIPVKTGFIFSISFLSLSLILSVIFCLLGFTSWWLFLPWGIIVIVLVGLAFHWFETPIARSLTLGILQSLYFFMGATSGVINIGMVLIALMFFFAMFGGRGVTDIRDFPIDKITPVQTMPKKYGLKNTARFVAICLIVAYTLSFGAYFTGFFNLIYLYLDIAYIVTGLIITALFLYKPTPKLAKNITMIYMMGQGTLICLATILGTITFS
jgi:4-hydroxybenzoate polyprenyltransferase